MFNLDAMPRKRTMLGAGMLIALGLPVFAMVAADDRADAPARPALCHEIDAATVAQLKPLLDKADAPAAAAVDRAVTTITAARRLCELGDTKSALMLFRRADKSLTRFQSAAQPSEDR